MTRQREIAARPVVGFFIPNLGWGGAERDISNLAQGLLRTRFVPRVFVWEHVDGIEGEVRRAGIEVHRVNRRFRFDLKPILTASKSLRSGKIALAHGVHSSGNLCVAAAGRLAGKRSVVVSMTTEADHPDHSRLTKMFHSWSLRTAPIVVTNSKAAESFLKARFDPHPLRCVVIPNGVDLDRFSPVSPEAVASLRSEFGWRDEELILLTVARFHSVKNHAALAQALLKVASSRPIRVVWIGVERGERAKMKQFADATGLSRLIEIRDHEANVESFYRASDLLVHPSLSEGLPNVVLEAMACGLPVLASNVGDTADYVRDGETGWLVDRGDQASLTQAVGRAIAAAPQQLETMGSRARERLIGLRMDVGTYVRRYIDLYEELVDAGAPDC